jgi:hypothetical protein
MVEGFVYLIDTLLGEIPRTQRQRVPISQGIPVFRFSRNDSSRGACEDRRQSSKQSYAKTQHNGDYSYTSVLIEKFFFKSVCTTLPGGGRRLQTFGGLAAQLFDSTLRTFYHDCFGCTRWYSLENCLLLLEFLPCLLPL